MPAFAAMTTLVWSASLNFFGKRQHVADPQRAPGVTAELAEREGRATTEIHRHIQSARYREIGAQAMAAHAAKTQHVAGLHSMRAAVGERHAVERSLHVGTGERDCSVAVKLERRAGDREFQAGGLGRISEYAVRQAECERMHRTGRRHPHLLVSDAS